MTRTSNPDFEQGTLNAYQIRGDEIQCNDRYGYKIVAVVDYSGRGWSAYRGPTGWSDVQVAQEGDHVSKVVAVAMFPTLAASIENYWL